MEGLPGWAEFFQEVCEGGLDYRKGNFADVTSLPAANGIEDEKRLMQGPLFAGGPDAKVGEAC